MPPLSSPTVSVIVAFHNDAPHVEAAITSLAALDQAPVEFLLVDDGSTDATASLLDQLAAQHPTMRVLRHHENEGVASARNRAMAEAVGEYLWFADPDDRWDAGILSTLVGGLGPGADLVVTGAEVVNANGTVVRSIDAVASVEELDGARALEAVLRGDISGYLWNKLFRRSHTAPFPLQRSLSDLPFVAATVASAGASAGTVRRIPGEHYTYVQRDGSITRAPGGVDLDDLARSAHAVIDTASAAPPALVTLFRYWFAVVPIHAQWALRGESSTDTVAGLDVRVRAGEIRDILALDRRTALKALWILCAGRAFAPMYRALTRGRRP